MKLRQTANLFFVFVTLSACLIPSVSLAITPVPPSNTQGNAVIDGLKTIEDQFPASNDLTASTSVTEVVRAVIKIFLAVVLTIAVLMIIVGGGMYMTSAGNEKQTARAKKTILYAILGIAIVILAYTIVVVTQNTLTN